LNQSRNLLGYFRDLVCDPRKETNEAIAIISSFNEDNLDISQIDPSVASYLSQMYRDHRFDLLGSGWVKNSYGSDSMGLEGHRYEMNLVIDILDETALWLKNVVRKSHLQKTREIWKLVDKEYIPIDWQKDYKSGYRWSAQKWHKHQRYGANPGADIKVPWELARMQHLPQMAMFAMVMTNENSNLTKEFKNQVLDFIATNPPRMGVNWTCTMDVAIRASNLLVAFDLFRSLDRQRILSQEFERIFATSIYLHGCHIIHNLEFSKTMTSNHYLSNICGLAFIASYLECTPEIDCWLAFSVQELLAEMNKQFYKDGGNFESSTSYHRLSGEMMAYATAIILGLSESKRKALRDYDHELWRIKEPVLRPIAEQTYNTDSVNTFPEWYFERLYKAGELTYHLTKPSGEIPQIGDNDSGRFFRLSPNGGFLTNGEAEARYRNLRDYSDHLETFESSLQASRSFWDENIINHSTFISAISGIFDSKLYLKSKNVFPLEHTVARSLAKGNFQKEPKPRTCGAITKSESDFNKYPFKNQEVVKPIKNDKTSLKRNLSLIQYPDSGIYIYKSDRIHLTVFAGPNGQNGNGGHAHNDKLSFELNIDGEDLTRDPGSYVYTPIMEMRNLFRSAAVHNGPHAIGIEPNGWQPGITGLFSLADTVTCKVLEFDAGVFAGEMNYSGIRHVRRIEVQDQCIIISDYSTEILDDDLVTPQKWFSNGYGKLIFNGK
jgi:hypothetical protein